ncbi:MAG: SBBP repeat-containing protein [Bacteroidota bacterium]
MKKLLLSICCAGITLTANAQWLRTFGGPSEDRGKSIAVDAAGNVYTTGWCSFNADLDPGPGTFTVATSGDDTFVSKVDASGNFVWGKRVASGGGYDDYGMAITVDALGNVYTTGKFKATIDLDPGAGNYTITAAGDYDVFISKLDASGNFIWGKTIGGTGEDVGNSVTVDALGNVYIAGQFKSTCDFDPGIGTYTVSSNGNMDLFILKLDVSGNLVWAQTIGAGSNDAGNGIKVDASGNVHVTGYFAGNVDFDPGAGIVYLAGSGSEVFVLKLDALGDLVWAKKMGASSTDKGTSIALDATGNVYTTGVTTDGADFDPGTGVFTLATGSAGSSVSFISKLDAAGDFVWAKGFGGSGSANGEGVAVDGNGNVYTTGSFTNLIDFDPGAATLTYSTSSTNSDIYVSKLNANGDFVWAKYMGGGSADNGYAITTDVSGNIYTTGSFYYAADFSSGAGTTTVTSVGFFDAFVLKMDPTGSIASGNVGISEYTSTNDINIFPNPSSGLFNVASKIAIHEIQIINLLGETVHSSTLNSERASIDLRNEPKGVYFYRIMHEERILSSGKIVVE